MSSRRVLKAAEAVREVVAMAILTDVRDPRVENVTVTFVEMSSDMRFAKVHVSVMGDEKKQDLCLHGLRNSAGYIQSKLNRRIDTRYTPRIQFVLDKGLQNQMEVTRILNQVLPKEVLPEENSPEDPPPDETVDLDASETIDANETMASDATVSTPEEGDSDGQGS